MTDTPDDDSSNLIRLKVKLTRGTDPRDSDEITGELIAPDLETYKKQVSEFRDSLYAEAEIARSYQPTDDDES